MRSLRRSLTLYLFGLLAVTLAVVWVVLDQMTARALAAREAAGADLIETRYKERCREENERVDRALLDQATALGHALQMYYFTEYDHEWAKSRAAIGLVPLGLAHTPFGANVLAEAAWTPIGNHSLWTPWGPRAGPQAMGLFRTYFANPPLPEEAILHVYENRFGDHRNTDFLQINTQSGREWRSPSLGSRGLPFDPKAIDTKVTDSKPEGKPDEAGKPAGEGNLIDWVTGSGTTADGQDKVRRVLLSIPHFGRTASGGRGSRGGSPREDRPPRPPGPNTPGRSLLGTYSAWAQTGFAGPAPAGLPAQATPTTPAPSEGLPRLYIQCARPQAAIDAALVRFAEERNSELAHLATEIHDARATLRLQVTIIALAAFLAIAVGGPLLVGRGLRPVGKLSDAVSRVSEKDFKFRYDGTDMTVELAPIHARITQTLDLLHRAFSREKQAVADISHELRTPIAALLATIDVALRKDDRPAGQYRAALVECRLISKQLGVLVERIMTLASLDAGNERTQISRVDGTDLAAGCASVIRPLAAANGITVETRLDDPLDFDTDAGKLREVLMNLLHNAVEYNRPDGSIELTARRDNGSVIYEVRDTGIGMNAEVREKIFERFYRADASRQATGVHAGLGLAIVREYVDRLGGTIAVESEHGVGSTFRVTLPAPHPAESPADEPVSAGA